jgi:hypothetical protein
MRKIIREKKRKEKEGGRTEVNKKNENQNNV